MSSVVPEGWSEDYISEYFDFSIGGTPSRNNELYWDANQTTSNIWVSIRDLKDKFISNSAERISDLGVSKSNVKLLPKNTVLMSFKLSIGRLAISMTPLYTNEAIVGFIEKRPNTVDRDYLYYGLQSWNLLGEVDQAVKGATLNKDKMSRILGVFPPLPEQKKIASILTSVDEVIENTQKQIDKLQDLKKATMNELLTKGIGHTEFKDSELGRIPKSWEVKSLEHVCEKIWIGLVTTMTKFYVEKGIPLIRNSDIKETGIRMSKLIQLDIDFSKKHSSRAVQKGDVVTVHTGDIGTSAVINHLLNGAQGFATLNSRINKSLIIPQFYSQILNSEDFKLRAKRVVTGDGRDNLNLKDFVGLLISVPQSLSEQENIVTILLSLEQNIDRLTHKLSQTQSLKKSLMQDLLTGKVRVSVH